MFYSLQINKMDQGVRQEHADVTGAGFSQSEKVGEMLLDKANSANPPWFH